MAVSLPSDVLWLGSTSSIRIHSQFFFSCLLLTHIFLHCPIGEYWTRYTSHGALATPILWICTSPEIRGSLPLTTSSHP